MSSLIIDRSGYQLESADGVLRLRRVADQAIERDIPFSLIERVVIRARCQLDSAVLTDLAAHGCSIHIQHGRAGQRVAQVHGAAHNDARRRWAQVLYLAHGPGALNLARAIVRTKLRRQRQFLVELQQLRPDLRKPVFDALAQLAPLLEQIAPQAPAPASLDALRGIEGAAAAAYFSAYFAAFAPALRPSVRSRRPPLDPVNAALSLSYTLLHSQASSACWRAGLDPALGALHAPAHGRAALACDLMEPLRPAIDRWVWELFRHATLRAEHFAHDGSGACLLGKAGRGHYWPLWNQLAPSLQRRLDRYAQACARQLQADADAHHANPSLHPDLHAVLHPSTSAWEAL